MHKTLLQAPRFFQLLLQIDIELAAQTRTKPCFCGGPLHIANYPRKPRACPMEVLSDFNSRFSFCCGVCRKRTTPESVRFLGRRVYLALVVIVFSNRQTGALAEQFCKTLHVPALTLRRWREWWVQRFPTTTLWQAACARFVPPVAVAELPGSLIARFAGSAAESMLRFMVFLMPLTIQQ